MAQGQERSRDRASYIVSGEFKVRVGLGLCTVRKTRACFFTVYFLPLVTPMYVYNYYVYNVELAVAAS